MQPMTWRFRKGSSCGVAPTVHACGGTAGAFKSVRHIWDT